MVASRRKPKDLFLALVGALGLMVLSVVVGDAAVGAQGNDDDAFNLIGQPGLGKPQGDLSRVAELMRALSGTYDQAARSAASL